MWEWEMQWRGLLQFVIGSMQAAGAALYLVLLTVVGFQPLTHLLGGFLVAITLVSLVIFGWPGRGKS